MWRVCFRVAFMLVAAGVALLALSAIPTQVFRAEALRLRVSAPGLAGTVGVSFHTSSSKLPTHRLGLRKSSEPVKPLLVVPIIVVATLEQRSDERRIYPSLLVYDVGSIQRSPRAPPSSMLVS
jgi:hypothetical protein